jgi:hypothetical protein
MSIHKQPALLHAKTPKLHHNWYWNWSNFVWLQKLIGSSERSVSTATAEWTTEELGYDSHSEKDIFLFSFTSRPDLGPTQPPTQTLQKARSLGVKRPGLDTDHLSPSSSEFNNILTPPYVFISRCLIKHWDCLTFYQPRWSICFQQVYTTYDEASSAVLVIFYTSWFR